MVAACIGSEFWPGGEDFGIWEGVRGWCMKRGSVLSSALRCAASSVRVSVGLGAGLFSWLLGMPRIAHGRVGLGWLGVEIANLLYKENYH